MTYLMGVILYTGAACVSPITTTDRTTIVGKTPCAEVIRYSSANPYKIVQEPNVVSVGKPRASSAKALAKPAHAKKKFKKKRRR